MTVHISHGVLETLETSADLSLITILERLDIGAIATLDSDFDVDRRFRKQHE